MCVKLPLGDLNPGIRSLHITSTNICEVTTKPRVRGGNTIEINSP